MNPLTLSYVRKHHITPGAFRAAAKDLLRQNVHSGHLYTVGLCTTVEDQNSSRGRFDPYIELLNWLFADSERGYLFWWRAPDRFPEGRVALRRYIQEAYTPRVVALELAALFVEDLLAGAVASGHNPDKLTNAQVGKGWRLLARKEIQARPLTPHIQSWGPGTRLWFGGDWRGSNEFVTYRTRKPAGYFLTR